MQPRNHTEEDRSQEDSPKITAKKPVKKVTEKSSKKGATKKNKEGGSFTKERRETLDKGRSRGFVTLSEIKRYSQTWKKTSKDLNS